MILKQAKHEFGSAGFATRGPFVGILPAAFYLHAATAPPTSLTVGFDDVDLGGARFMKLPGGYDNLQWRHFFAITSIGAAAGSGYVTGVTSGTQTAFNGHAELAYVSIHRGSFALESVNMTAAWDSKLTVDIYGYRDGVELYHRTVHITDTGPTAVRLHFTGVDQVTFFPGAGQDDPKLDGMGAHIAFDDFLFTDITSRESGGASLEAGLSPISSFGHADLSHVGMHALM